MKKTAKFLPFVLLFVGIISNAQDIVWTGNASNNDFFDENNWKNSITELAPVAGSIDPSVAINLSLIMNNSTTTVVANGVISLGTGTLAIGSSSLTATSFSGGNVIINEGAYVDLSATAPLANAVKVNFTSGIGWIRTLNTTARTISISNLGQIKVNGVNSVYKTNLRLDNYYRLGCVIRSNEASTAPLTVYDGINLQETSASITVNTIHSGESIANGMNNKIESFVLKKGFMVTIADESDGTGSSKNFIASESDLIINSLPKVLLNSISFIRILPWNWVTKKGVNDVSDINMNSSWRYQWNHTESSSLFWEFAPMSWGHGTTTDSGIAGFIAKYGSPYIMSFNEPDDCDAQSGQYGFPGSPKLCNVDEAVKLHKNFMKTGMRIVSPGGREEAPFGWLKEFHQKATAQNIRIDVIAVHWYDWGSNPTVNTSPTAQQVFDRFKAYLTRVHDYYGLPIWITEFNANPARSQAINAGFLALALPYLESLDYIERYCWFPFDSGTHFSGWNEVTDKEADETISLVGTIYKNINNTTPRESSPSVPEATFSEDNNLNLLTYPNIALNKSATANSSFTSDFLPSKAIDGDVTSSSSQWFANIGDTNAQNFSPLPAWIEVDLQGSYTIDSFRIIEASKALKDFEFQVWDSGTGVWTSALTVTGNPATPLTTFKTITPVTTTKVRLYITAHNSTNYLRMFELEVYGKLNATLATKPFDKQILTLYPNPVTNGFININGEIEVQSVDVYDTLGTKINVSYTSNQLDVSTLSTGIYFIKINKKYSFKFIKS
jgi:hypothetical protein